MRDLGRKVTRNRKGKLRIWPLLLFGAYLIYYFASHQETVPVTGRTQLIDISRQQEIALGLSSYREILSQEDVIGSGPEVKMLRNVAKRVAAVVDAKDMQWEFNLIRSEQANAFALPGGKVAVYTGILPITQNEDGLATVLGHEIAHAVARHGAERMAHQRLTQVGTLAVGASIGDMEVNTQRIVLGALGIGSRFGILLPYSRKHESEADYIGLIYLAKACFNPEEAPLLWERMAEANRSTPPEFMSTHPAPSTRISQFREWMPEAKRIFTAHCKS